MYLFRKNDRIAQLIIEKIEPTEVVEVNELADTVRGEDGFGSTGVVSENNVVKSQ
jgi:dUTP pyrophosphatase